MSLCAWLPPVHIHSSQYFKYDYNKLYNFHICSVLEQYVSYRTCKHAIRSVLKYHTKSKYEYNDVVVINSSPRHQKFCRR
jgi:hypothetical protein